MSDRGSLRLRTGWLIAGGVLLLLIVGTIAAAASLLAPRETARFMRDPAGPSCTVSGETVRLILPIAQARGRHPDPDILHVDPQALSGMHFDSVTTVPASSAHDPGELDPRRWEIQIPSGSQIHLMFRLTDTRASIDGIRIFWSVGESAYTQLLPGRLSADSSGCTIH